MRILTFKKVYLIHGKQRLERLWIFKLIKENFSPTGSREDRSWLYLSAFVLNMVPLPHQSTVFLRLGKAGWYCVTKALFFLFVYLFSSNSCLPYFFSAPEQVFDKHMPQWCNLFEWIYRSGFPLFVSSGIRGRILRKRRWKLRNHDIHFQINIKWFEFGGNMWSCSLIVLVRVVFVGCGDWHFDNLSGSRHQGQVKRYCQSNALV